MKHKKLIRIKLKHTDLRRIRLKKQTNLRRIKLGTNQFAGSHQLLCRFLLLSPLLGGSTGSLFWVVKVLFDQDCLNKVPSRNMIRHKLVHFSQNYLMIELTLSGLESLPLYFSLCFWLFVPYFLFHFRKILQKLSLVTFILELWTFLGSLSTAT